MNFRPFTTRTPAACWTTSALRYDRETTLASAETALEPSIERTEPEYELSRLRDDPEEAAWLLRARQGDTAAFEWLMDRYRARAIRLATHILRRPTEAEDLVQEAFVRAFVQIENFRGESAFYSWLYTIVVRLALNRMRQPQWYREWDLVVDEDVGEPQEADTAADRHATRMLIDMLLDRLSPPLRAALVLRELDGLDYAEIASALNIPVGTVRSRLNTARRQFRTLWEGAMEEIANV